MAKDDKENNQTATDGGKREERQGKSMERQQHGGKPDEHSPEYRYESANESQHNAADANMRSIVASAALIGVGALIQPELFVGMLVGAGAVLASRNLDRIREAARPLIRNAVRTGYAATIKAAEMASEASEEFQDFLAEARTDYHQQ